MRYTFFFKERNPNNFNFVRIPGDKVKIYEMNSQAFQKKKKKKRQLLMRLFSQDIPDL